MIKSRNRRKIYCVSFVSIIFSWELRILEIYPSASRVLQPHTKWFTLSVSIWQNLHLSFSNIPVMFLKPLVKKKESLVLHTNQDFLSIISYCSIFSQFSELSLSIYSFFFVFPFIYSILLQILFDWILVWIMLCCFISWFTLKA